MGQSDAKRQWIEAVLGFRFPAEEPSTASAGAAEPAPEDHSKTIKQCQDRWNRALESVYRTSKPFHSRMSDEAPRNAAGLDSILESYWSDLVKPLSQARRAKPGQDALGPVLEALKALRAELRSDQLFQQLQTVGVPVGAEFERALDDIETTLTAER